jgi:ComF family protein
MVSRYREEVNDVDLLIPVPMHKYKRLGRLYNHSQILAQDIARLLEKKINSDILLKVKNTLSQSGLGRKFRTRNLLGSINIRNNHKVKGKKILLVDDVMTTCSTANICASKLKKAGAKGVKVLCIARRMLDNT